MQAKPNSAKPKIQKRAFLKRSSVRLPVSQVKRNQSRGLISRPSVDLETATEARHQAAVAASHGVVKVRNNDFVKPLESLMQCADIETPSKSNVEIQLRNGVKPSAIDSAEIVRDKIVAEEAIPLFNGPNGQHIPQKLPTLVTPAMSL